VIDDQASRDAHVVPLGRVAPGAAVPRPSFLLGIPAYFGDNRPQTGLYPRVVREEG